MCFALVQTHINALNENQGQQLYKSQDLYQNIALSLKAKLA